MCIYGSFAFATSAAANCGCPVSCTCPGSTLTLRCSYYLTGGHLNPAVSAGMLVARKISVLRFVLYVGMQMAGACTGAALAKAVRPVLRSSASPHTSHILRGSLAQDRQSAVQAALLSKTRSIVLMQYSWQSSQIVCVLLPQAPVDPARAQQEISGPGISAGPDQALSNAAHLPHRETSTRSAKMAAMT